MDPVIRKKLQYTLLAGAVLLGVLLVFMILTTASYSRVTIHETPFTETNYTTLQGDSLYSYNGAGFYKVDPKTSKITILNSSARLPGITHLSWAGDKGALMTFGDDGLYGSDVERELAARGISPETDTSGYLWYLDFPSGKLQLVYTGVFDMVQARFIPAKNQFYFVAQIYDGPKDIDTGYLTSYLSYDLTDQTVKTLVNDLGLDEVTHIGQCKETQICVLQTGEDLKLWTESNGSKRTVYDFKDYDGVTATGITDTYVVTKNDPVGTTEDEEDELLQSTPTLLSLDGKKTPLSIKTSANAPLVTNTFNASESKNYILDTTTKDSDGIPQYLSTGKTVIGNLKTAQYTLTLDSGDEFMSHVLGGVSYGDNGTTLFTDIEHKVYYVTEQSEDFKLNGINESNLVTTLKQCLDKHTTFNEYSSDLKQLRVGIKYDQNYSTTISNYSKCIATVSPEAFIGYNFTFVGVDPVSGRFVTN